MKFVIIDATARKVERIEALDLEEALPMVGLASGEVDFGTLFVTPEGAGVSIVVYEWGLRKPPAEGRYFSIGTHLYEGNAVLFGFDSTGETIDLNHLPPVMFYRSHREVEAAIVRGAIMRPQTSINDEVTWQWPEQE